jgi:hypothetical protein
MVEKYKIYASSQQANPETSMLRENHDFYILQHSSTGSVEQKCIPANKNYIDTYEKSVRSHQPSL